MYLDAQNMFSKEQALTATAVSDNVVDFGSAHGDDLISVAIAVDEDIAGATDLTVELQTSDVPAMTGAKSIASTGKIAAADLKKGGCFEIKCPAKTGERYMRLNFVVGGTATAGKVTAAVCESFQSNGAVK
jgi:hypothetical protein